jgi:peptidyl-prolyl cis-trans isomerase C
VSRILPLLLALLAVSCTSSPPVATNSTTAAEATPLPAGAALPQVAVKPVPAELPEIVARVNGEIVSKADVERAVQTLEGRAGGPVPADQRDRIVRGVVDQLVGYRLLTQEAAARKVTVPDADVTAQIATIQGQFPSEQVFAQTLAERKISLDQVRADARRDLIVAKLLKDEVEAKSTVTAEQVQDFYAKNPDQFMQGERVRASHILISVPKDANAAAKAQGRSRAAQVLKDLKAGQDFAALAKQHSQDPGSAPQGGDLGYFTQGQMVGPFNDVAFTLKPGTTSELVETDFGFHIIRVVDRQAGRTVPIEEVRPQVEEFLRNKNRQQHTETFIGGLRAKGQIELFI